MEDRQARDELSAFLESGIYRFEDSNFVFVDPVRVLNRSYSRFRVSPAGYYRRFFDLEDKDCSSPAKKRKREENEPLCLNERELAADQRHQAAKPLFLKAHELLLQATDLLRVMRSLNREFGSSAGSKLLELPNRILSLIECGRLWQAPLMEITLKLPESDQSSEVGGSSFEHKVVPLFNSLVVNDTSDEVEAEFLNHRYILPRQSGFYMSNLRQPALRHVHNLIPDTASSGFNLIVVDPPWENGSAQQKAKYPTLPNRYFLGLPIKKLSHSKGALVALWVTNREKFHRFIELELFPAWGVAHISTYYWLKVKADASLISDLDLFHHRPYECLLLGYCYGEDVEELKNLEQTVPKDRVIVSIPGEYSRKPPIGELLQEYVPGPKPGRCIELFAREMNPGCFSWGNEPIHFQESQHFTRRT